MVILTPHSWLHFRSFWSPTTLLLFLFLVLAFCSLLPIFLQLLVFLALIHVFYAGHPALELILNILYQFDVVVHFFDAVHEGLALVEALETETVRRRAVDHVLFHHAVLFADFVYSEEELDPPLIRPLSHYIQIKRVVGLLHEY